MDSDTELPTDSLRLRNWQTDVVYIYTYSNTDCLPCLSDKDNF